jgi:hypothetical protein
MADIFISYKREDAERVQQLAVSLETEGFSVWWDPDLPIGHTYSSSIHTQLNTAKAVMPVWTERSVDSEWVQEEAAQGKRRGVLLPVRLDTVESPLGFTMVQTADLSDWSGGQRDHPEWRRLVDQAHALVGGSRPAAAMPPQPPRRKPRRTHFTRRHFATAAAVVAALAIGGVAFQNSCNGTSRDGSQSSTDTRGGDSAATRAPRDVPAPVVGEGQHASFAEARVLALGVAEPGEIFSVEDPRFYRIENRLKLRDRALVRLENMSTTMKPHIKIYNARRSEVANRYDHTPGAHLEDTLTLTPGEPIYVQVLPYGSVGKYKLSVTPQQAFDAYEANDDVLSASAVTIAKDVVANVMDTEDQDWYRVTGALQPRVTVMFQNLSSTLKPHVRVFDANKSEIVKQYNPTPGADLTLEVALKQPREFYVQVLPFETAGKYRLRIE